MDSFVTFIYKKEKKAADKQIQLELELPIDEDSPSKLEDNTPRVIIIDIL